MRLIDRTRRPFWIYAAVVMLLSVPAYLYLLEGQGMADVDDDLEITARNVQQGLNAQNLSADELALTLQRLNALGAGVHVTPVPSDSAITPGFSTVERHDDGHGHDEPFRTYTGTIVVQGRPYAITVQRVVEETEELVIGIAAVSICSLIVLIVGVMVLDRISTKRLWAPFQRTLESLRRFNVDDDRPIAAERTGIAEFDELNTALEQLTQRNRAIYAEQRRFTENAAHEMRTPLALLQGKVDRLFQVHGLTEEQAHLLEEANAVLARMRRMHDALVLLARLDNDPAPLQGTVEPLDVVRHVLDTLAYAIEENRLRVETGGEEGATWTMQPALAELLITNLLTNAVRHSDAGAAITVQADGAGLTVSNTGAAPLDEARLFTRFSSNGRGLGLGLAIAKRVCERCGWYIGYAYEQGAHVFRVSAAA